MLIATDKGWRCAGCGVETPGPLKACPCATDCVHDGAGNVETRLKAVEYTETMWAEMKPDCYGGKTCDKIEPQWWTYADGDKEGGYEHAPLQLAARTFPPGTKIVVSEPLCPQCSEPREPKFPTPKKGPLYAGPCRCGFDWDAWVLGEYS
jgi:hypothetical protein